MNCEWVKENVILYVYDELADDSRIEMEQHAEHCPACAAEIAAARGFHQEMSARPQVEVSPNFLAASRMKLSEALETTEQSQWRKWLVDPTEWLRQIRFSPALASAILILGFAAGTLTAWQIVDKRVDPNGPPGVHPGTADNAEANIAGIHSISPVDGSNNVEITYDKLVPTTAKGDINDPRIQQLLLLASRSQANSGVRIDSMNLLSQKSDENNVREVLMSALRYDKNPGVRLKALQGLQSVIKSDTRVRDAVLEALMHDTNSGVRAEALRVLQPVKADSSVRITLEELARNDKNAFIKLESERMLGSLPQLQ
jgi:HEAT repeat protein/putative zinc finger protein